MRSQGDRDLRRAGESRGLAAIVLRGSVGLADADVAKTTVQDCTLDKCVLLIL